MLARGKSLLGKPYDEVSGDYQTTYDHSEPGFRRIKVAEQAGWIMEHRADVSKLSSGSLRLWRRADPHGMNLDWHVRVSY